MGAVQIYESRHVLRVRVRVIALPYDEARAREGAKKLDQMLTEAETGSPKAPANNLGFDPRTEVSADAKYIVRNLLLWFLIVPLAVAVLIWVMR